MASTNVLSAGSLANIIGQSLPASTSGPQIKNAYDAVAIAAHAAMLAVGFRLIGLSEDDRTSVSKTRSIPVLPTQWNLQSPANYSFAYAHTQSSMEFVIKINRLGSKAVILGMGIGDDKTISFDVKVNEYTSAGNLPASPIAATSTSPAGSTPTPSEPGSSAPAESTDKRPEVSVDSRKAITDIYISPGRLSDFGALIRLNLIQKLLPSLHKDGYEETASTSTDQSNARSSNRQPAAPSQPQQPDPARPQPLHDDPLRAPPRRPNYPQGDFPPPDFEDEHGILRPHRPLGGGFAGPSIGHRDLYPAGLGPNDPFRSSIGPGIGGMGGGGMHPTFDDPLFRGQGRGGEAGGDPFGFDPQAPPGARYDPVGPGGAPRGSGGGGQSGFGRPPNPFGGFGGGDFI